MLLPSYAILSIATDTLNKFMTMESVLNRNMAYEKTQQARINTGLCKDCGRERYYESTYCRSEYIRGIASKYGVPTALHEALLQKVEAMEDLRGREFYRRLPMKQEALPREGKKLQAQSRGEMSP